jgi:predicted MPP superfamily phosphohydrolase
MFRRTVSGIVLALLLANMLTLAFNIQPVETELSSLTVAEKSAAMQGTINLASEEPPPTEWNRTYGGINPDEAYDLVQTVDGGYALAGYTRSYGAGNVDSWLIKTDALGNAQWNKTYGGTNNDKASALVQTGDGGYTLAGYTRSYGAGNYDFWLVKVDASGIMMWDRTYGGTNDDSACALVQTTDGGYALAGGTRSFGAGNCDIWLIKTAASGSMQWNKTYGGIADDGADALVQTNDGGYALAGLTGSYGAGAWDLWLVKTDSAGNAQWNRTYGGIDYDEALALVQTADGGYALAGYTGSNNDDVGGDFWLVKTDASGIMMWNRTYGGTNDGLALALVQTTDGGYALAGGTCLSGAGNYDCWLVKTDASGNMQWNETYGGISDDLALALVQTADGGYALAGRTNSFGAGSVDFWLVKIAPSNGGHPDDCGCPMLVAPVQISSNAGYSVGDTLTARFTIQNQGTATIHLDKLLFGGRFNGGTLPGGGFPDFSYSSVTLPVGQTYQYEGTLYLTEAGYYQFFVAYYIANPTEAEKQLLDSNNWNTCIDLAPGLTDSDRTWDRSISIDRSSTFAIITDLHIGRGYPEYNGEDYYLTARLQEVVDWIRQNHESKNIEFVVVLGDLTENGKQSEINKAKGILDHLNDENISYFPVIGNHDHLTADGDKWFDSVFNTAFYTQQCEKLGTEWIDNRTTLDPVIGPLIHLENYAFEYEDRKFIFLDFVERNFPSGASAQSWEETETSLLKLLSGGKPAVLFSHHPMIQSLALAFSSDELSDISSIITAARNIYGTEVLGDFAGHVHGYFDPSHSFYPGGLSYSSKRDLLSYCDLQLLDKASSSPIFVNANGNYRDEGFATPTDIPVISTEAMMVGSNEPNEKGVIRIVVAGDEITTFEDGASETASLNPYIISATTGELGWYENGVDFRVYAFTRMFDVTHPIEYSLYLDGEFRKRIDTSCISSVFFLNQRLAHGTHEVNLTVVGYTSDGRRVVESIKRSVVVGTLFVHLKCPADVVVTDPAGRSISRQMNEIPDATYTEADLDEDGDLDGFVEILAPLDGNYVFTLNGTDLGLYSMISQLATSQEVLSFNATQIPVSLEAVHRYTINWTALSQGEERVDVQVDSGGDGVFECNFTSDTELSRVEYVAATTKHDLEIFGLTSSKSIVGDGYAPSINVGVMNYGVYAETFNITAYANNTLVASQVITLTNTSSTTVTFTWNTSGFAYGNYTITAYAEPVLNETYVADNNVTYVVPVHVGVPGDVSSSTQGVYDGKCDMKDIAYLVTLFNTKPNSPNWNPNADVDNNAVVSMKDIAIAILNFNKHE